MFNTDSKINDLVEYDNIAIKFKGNFYINFNKFYYIFEGLGYYNLHDNINLNEDNFLNDSVAIIEIYKESADKLIDTKKFDLSKLNKNYIEFNLSEDNIELLQDFKIIINIIYKDSNIYDNYISFKEIKNKYNNKYNDNIDINISRIIPVIVDLNQNINFENVLCLNCTNEDLNNIKKELNTKNFYSVHKMNKILNFKYLDYKIYSTFLKNKKFKYKDIIAYIAQYDQNNEYDFMYESVPLSEKNYIINFFYKLKNLLIKLNYNSLVHQKYNIKNDKRKIVLYVQEFKKLQSKNFFQFVIQQNLKNII